MKVFKIECSVLYNLRQIAIDVPSALDVRRPSINMRTEGFTQSFYKSK